MGLSGLVETTTHDYTPADREACLAVFDTNVPDFFTEAERAEYAAFLAALPGPYLLLRDGAGEVVACGGIAIVAEERRADLCWGMVLRRHHGEGVGRELTRVRLARARVAPEVVTIALNTSQHTTGFYERMGFETVEVVPDGYAPGLDRCEMRLRLEDSG